VKVASRNPLELTRGASLVRARSVCESCPVAPACLRMALDDDTLVGILAGTTRPRTPSDQP
jgi:LSD1 subclass zinc finger protein